MSSASSVPTVKLSDGTQIPVVGFGTGTRHWGKECKEAVSSALKIGYTYLDGAQMYGNAASIREALKETGVKREDIFILSKCGKDGAGAGNNPRTVLVKLLEEMGVSYVDLYLVHSPLMAAPMSLSENWKIMEELKKEGLTKSIGVSNYREEDLAEMAPNWKVAPSVNQIEYHPYVYHLPQMIRLRAICDKYDIKIETYGPLTPLFRSTGGPVDEVVKKIAEKKGATEGQVLLAWAKQHSGGVAVTTSSNAERQREQLEAFTKMSPLSPEEVEEIAEAGKGRTYRHFMLPVWNPAKP